jgi:hypothetical protein
VEVDVKMATYKIKINYDDENRKYYIYIDSDDADVQCFYTSEEAPTVVFTRNLKDIKRVVDSSVYVS